MVVCACVDVKKMPLGKLSKSQIAKGFEVLEEIEQCLNSSNRSRLSELSSRFYTLIPHDFGRKVPPVIGDAEMLRSKMDMLLVCDITLIIAVYFLNNQCCCNRGCLHEVLNTI